jgi:hypothetical protein
MEEKDLFDMFREGSENLTEQPATDSWKRLERRLASAKATKKRKPLPLQLMVVVATVALLLTAAVVNWVVAKDHQARLKNQKDFESLQFLVGKWSASEGNVIDELAFEPQNAAISSKESQNAPKNVKILRGVKTLHFKDLPVQTDTFLLENQGKKTIFTARNQVYELKNIGNSAFLFIASDGAVVRLRNSGDERFTLSFGEGQIFLYRK